MRKLASVQKVASLSPIPGADRIEVAEILGWQVVVQKDLHKVGDLVVYFEIDSILPAQPWCEFMEPRKYRVKTIKLRKQISQGLCIPIPEIPKLAKFTNYLVVGEDLTDKLEVTKHDPAAAKENAAHGVTQAQPIPHGWMLKLGPGRWLFNKLWPQALIKGFPEWFPKTDETRVQNLPKIDKMVLDRQLYFSEKLDGQSATFFYLRNEKVGLFKRGLFGVCSRNIWYKKPVANNWWNMAEGLEMEERLRTYCDENERSLAIQGEIVGPGIQKNRYQREDKEVYFFNVWDIDAECYLPLMEKLEVLTVLGLTPVPICSLSFVAPEGFDYVAAAEGKTLMMDVPTLEEPFAKSGTHIEREGLVFRDTEDDGFSFKAISNKFLLKEE